MYRICQSTFGLSDISDTLCYQDCYLWLPWKRELRELYYTDVKNNAIFGFLTKLPFFSYMSRDVGILVPLTPISRAVMGHRFLH